MRRKIANSVEQSRRWLAWFLEQAQQPDSNLERDSAEIALREFALSLAPGLLVDWDSESFGAPSGPSVMKPKRHRRKRPKTNDCVACGRPGVHYRKPNRSNPFGSWFCSIHEAAARREETEDEVSDRLMPSLPAANAPRASSTLIAKPQRTDVGALPHEVLEGLRSFLANSEWTFPPLKLTPTVALGSGKNAKPELSSMGTLHDVVLAGISDLLMEHGRKIRQCAGRDCNSAFLSVRRQKFCSKKCAWRARFERFKRNLGGDEGFSERRHRYYKKAQRQKTGKPNLRVRRRTLKGKQK